MNHTFLRALAACLAMAVAWARADPIETEVCVFGATSGGVTAAVQAARMGKSVVLLSTNTHVGGMTSGGLGETDVGSSTAIGGMALEFYQRIGTRYGVTGAKYNFEPHVAEEEFQAMLSAAGVTLRTNQRLASVTMNGLRIAEITMDDGTVIRARMFIDTTYEGDLMAAAGVTWTLGRESAATYGESFNGVTAGSPLHQFPVNVDPYVTPGDPGSGLLPEMQADNAGSVGDGDSRLQAYNYRICLTANAANRRAINVPPGYSEARYELLGRLIEARTAGGQAPQALSEFMTFASMPNQKSDNNNNGPFSTDYIGGNAGYVTGTYAQRALIAQAHLEYIQGFLYYLGHSTRVPASIRNQMLTYGTCLDEFADTDGWPHQLYVREARRMISDYVMTQKNCLNQRVASDSVGLGSYPMDSHSVRRCVKNGAAWNEGVVVQAGFAPYQISYRSIVPRVGECENLLVPWSVSASHVAFGSIRMEPVFMILSQSAGAAAAFALDGNLPVQQVPYAKLALQLAADGQIATYDSTQPLAIVVDNADATGVTVTGAWTTSSSVSGYAGSNYFHDSNAGKGTKSVRFTPVIPVSGPYDVYLRWTSATNRASNVPVDVTHAGGTTTFPVDQRSNGGTWVKLNTGGPLTLSAGTSASVLVRTTGTDSFVVADAVQFAPCTVGVVATDSVASELVPANHARFTVVRPGDQTATDWTVNYSVGGTALPALNFVALTGSVIIPAGQLAATIDVAPIPNDLAEGNKTLSVTLLPGASYQVGTLDSATATILDKPAVQVAATDANASEVEVSDTALFTVSRDSSQTAVPWTVFYTVNGTATPGADYVALPGSVTIPAGAISATITVTAIADDLAEGPETVGITLLPDPAFSPDANASATVTILDKPTVQVGATDLIASEADVTNTALFTVFRDPSQTALPWTVNYSVSGTATPGADYVALSGSVVIPAGEISATIPVAAIADDLAEGPETVGITLLPDAAFSPGAGASATATILDKPIDSWRFTRFTPAELADPAISGENANPDQDAFTNLTEYALGLDPFAPEAAAAVTAWDVTGCLTLTYAQRRAATDVLVIAEGSTDLHTWSAGPETIEEVSRIPQGELDIVTVRLVPLNPPAGFLRVRVARP